MSALQEALHGPDLPGKGALSAHRPGLPCLALPCLALPGSSNRRFEEGEGGARQMRKKRGGGSGEVELPERQR